MNIFLWILQIIVALHTIIGAMWKFSNSQQTVFSLTAIPHKVWLAMSVFEILCSLCLIIPAFNKRLGILSSIAAICIAVEMLIFSVLNVYSSYTDYGSIIYWLVVAAVCAFIVYGRFVLKPFQKASESR